MRRDVVGGANICSMTSAALVLRLVQPRPSPPPLPQLENIAAEAANIANTRDLEKSTAHEPYLL